LGSRRPFNGFAKIKTTPPPPPPRVQQKQFKLSCRKVNAKFHGMMVQNSIFTAFFSPFTANTCVMVIVSDSRIEPEAVTSNIEAARGHFSALIPTSGGGGGGV
jgi:hypothetical protein